MMVTKSECNCRGKQGTCKGEITSGELRASSEWSELTRIAIEEIPEELGFSHQHKVVEILRKYVVITNF